MKIGDIMSDKCCQRYCPIRDPEDTPQILIALIWPSTSSQLINFVDVKEISAVN